MLKYIKVKNFLSFKEETEINFESSLRGKKDNVFNI
jgi:AAA15 family ATPase/GTPase